MDCQQIEFFTFVFTILIVVRTAQWCSLVSGLIAICLLLELFLLRDRSHPPAIYRNGLRGGMYCLVLPVVSFLLCSKPNSAAGSPDAFHFAIQMQTVVAVVVKQAYYLACKNDATWSCLTFACLLSTFWTTFVIDHSLATSQSCLIWICTAAFNMMIVNIYKLFPNTFSCSEGIVVCQAAIYYAAHVLLLCLWYGDVMVWFNLSEYEAPWFDTRIVMIMSVWLLAAVILWNGTANLSRASQGFLLVLVAGSITGVIILMMDDVVAVTYHICNNYALVALIAFWLVISCLCIGIVIFLNKKGSMPNITSTVRKYFHLGALLIYLPGLYVNPELTKLASSAAFTAFLAVEFIRYHRLLEPIGSTIHQSLKVFLDCQDQGKLILTHIYLLTGCSLPLWLASRQQLLGSHISLYSGVTSLCVGDSFASICGKLVGRHKYPGTQKTVEGTIGAWTSMMVFTLMLAVIHGYELSLTAAGWRLMSVAIIESTTKQVDNLILPLYTYMLLFSAF